MADFVVQQDGSAVTAEELAPLAFAGYAHFTAMQVRDHRVRGLDLHLRRLTTASEKLFGRAIPEERMRSYLHTAVQAGPPDISLAAFVHSTSGEFSAAEGDPRMLIRTSAPSSGPSGPLALTTIEHERFLPTVKHVGEIAKTYTLRQAVAAGFDDVAFIDRRGRISEGTIWNLAFWDGDAVVWPEAEILTGTTSGILERQLTRLGITQRVEPITLADIPSLSGAVVMNSWTPAVAVHRIDDALVPPAPEFVDLLHRASRSEPLTAFDGRAGAHSFSMAGKRSG
ncbi:aminotransferase class IV family protein [Nocardia pseudobrasiliensis]|uniref:Branched-subunit amino acid aminotransferase/4-amino-4-deoxychorismate lyase n=1 Tax=Nocardia pseudobrasiliensis TaxID=45979 RepID=A0A370HS26_9NOCA|nr:aminotransferase class IV family protein [Nocardia pseudobrasiliensis]RDI61339.1 branched-subunit amino acid aminotransferase/4-amino-4-deoxychorismate lyase [Nocardia pseudobrasiliensis]